MHGRSHLPQGSDPIPGIDVNLVEASAVWGRIICDGSGGTFGVASGALNATTTLIPHNFVDVEQGVDCDIVSSPTRIVVETAGLYVIQSLVVDLDTGGGDYGLCVSFGFNATGAIWSPTGVDRRVVNGLARPQGLWFQNLDVGDYVTQVVGQNSGSTKTFAYLGELTVARFTGALVEELGTIDGGAP